jgi:hypothetical protein
VVGKIDLDDVLFAVCLDSLAKNNGLNMIVSKPPKEGQPTYEFLKVLTNAFSVTHSLTIYSTGID